MKGSDVLYRGRSGMGSGYHLHPSLRPPMVLSIIALVLALHNTPALALDPCASIDQSDAAAILGEAVKEGRIGTVSGFAGGLSCKDLVEISSQKGREDLEQQVSAHRLQKSRDAALGYILPKVSTAGK